MSNTERMAVAAHLHVALRRKAGRVTDTDWVAVNDEYACEVVRLARAKAQELADAGLAELANRLELLLQPASTRTVPPLAQRLGQGLRQEDARADGDEGGRYIGGLR